MHDQHGVKRAHPKYSYVCNIERGIAEQTKNQHLGWPSSCESGTINKIRWILTRTFTYSSVAYVTHTDAESATFYY